MAFSFCSLLFLIEFVGGQKAFLKAIFGVLLLGVALFIGPPGNSWRFRVQAQALEACLTDGVHSDIFGSSAGWTLEKGFRAPGVNLRR